MEKEKLNNLSDGSRKKAELSEKELSDVSGGGLFDITYEDIPNSPSLNRYVRILETKKCGQIIRVRHKYIGLADYIECTIRLNSGGEVVVDSEFDFEFLPPGVIDLQDSPEGNGSSATF